VPVILLTARGEEMDQVRGLEQGADDYLVKPIKYAALMARIRAVLRRAELPPPTQALPDFVAGELAVNFQAHEVTVAGERLQLTPVEYKLLYQLVRNAGHLLPHRALLDRVWGPDYDASPEYLKVFISRLRAKLRRPGSPEYIETERGIGYRFVMVGKSMRPPTSPPSPSQTQADETPSIWLDIDRIDASPETRNSRRIYDNDKLAELANSIREHGVLQPILVTPVGDRFEVIAGNRRLQAARMVGLERIPATVRSEADESHRLILNLVENAQRVDLSPTERVEAVRQLASVGMGVREIARGTGLSPGTVSRWIRIAANAPLLHALDEGRIDLFRAMHLASVREESALLELIAVAHDYSPDAFYELVQQRVAGSNSLVDRDERRLALVAERLTRVHSVTPAAVQHLQSIVEAASALLKGAESQQVKAV
jgi:ParB/RepB/Spo0J family partition protein